jgi:hypothetical protein
MNEIWEYLNLDSPEHDFNNVKQYTKEHEIGWPYGDHTIRNKVEAVEEDWNKVLGRELSEQIRQSFKWINDL